MANKGWLPTPDRPDSTQTFGKTEMQTLRKLATILLLVALGTIDNINALPEPIQAGPSGLTFHGRRQKNTCFGMHVQSPDRIRLLVRTHGRMERIDTRVGERIQEGRFQLEQIEQNPAKLFFCLVMPYELTIYDYYTDRRFVLKTGQDLNWPDYFAAFSWGSTDGALFYVQEGSEFLSPDRKVRFKLRTVEVDSVVVSRIDQGDTRFHLSRIDRGQQPPK